MSDDTKPGPISWEEAAAFSEEYELVLSTETHNHPLLIDSQGTLRWEADPLIDELSPGGELECIDLNKLFANGADKNDPRIRELYRKMGYSLSGYWEVFYWDWNNPKWDEYVEVEAAVSGR